MSNGETPPDKTPNQLHRSLGLKDTVLFGVGVMLGAGIYAIIGEAAGLAGNQLWLAFLLAAGVAFLTALSYAEFVSRFPDAGGSFEYIKQAFGSRVAYIAGVLIFFTGVVAAAAIAISFGSYLSRLIDVPTWLSVIVVILGMAAVNIVGVQSSSHFNTVATVITVVGLLVVVGSSIGDWGEADLFATPPGVGVGVVSAAALIFFSFVGFEDLVKMAEETNEPRRTLPKALLISSGVVLLIYLLVAVSVVSVMDWKELAEASGPLSAVIETKLGEWGSIFLVAVALFATSKTIMSNILGTSRLLYDISRDSGATWLQRLSKVHGKLGTPVAAILFVSSIAIAFGLIGNLSIVASISNAFVMTVFAVVNLSLVVWRWQNPNAEKAEFHLPMKIGRLAIIPCLGIVATLILLGFNFANLMG